MRGAFVVGLARSGTSLLKSLLDGHPEVWAPPGESMAADWCAAPDPAAACLQAGRDLRLVERATPEYEAFSRVLRATLDGPTDPTGGVLAWITAAAEVAPPAPKARVWVEKTPKHLRSVPILLDRLGPATRVVCVVRDPRAVLASHRQRWGAADPLDARGLAKRWALADALAAELDARHPEVLPVRYEDLVADPQSAMRRVATLEPALVAELELLLHRRMLRRGYPPQLSGAARWRHSVAGLRRVALALATWQRLAAERRRWRRLQRRARAVRPAAGSSPARPDGAGEPARPAQPAAYHAGHDASGRIPD